MSQAWRVIGLLCLIAILVIVIGTVTGKNNSKPSADIVTRVGLDTGVQDFPLHEKVPPTVIEPRAPRPVYISMYDENVKIECRTQGFPEPSITWYRDGVRLTNADDRIQIYSDGTLELERFYSDDDGYFQCRATNPLGTSLSQLLHIQLEKSSGGSSSGTKHDVTESYPFSMPCDNMPETIPKLIKRWYYEKNNEVPETARIGIDMNGTLHFAFTKPEDGVKYTCGLVPETSLGTKTQIFLFPKGEIAITDREDGSSSLFTAAPTLAYSVSNVKAVIGRKAVLECFFSAKPTATITWKNSSHHDITKGNSRFKVGEFGRKLIIDPVMQQDEGQFTCTGSNNHGADENTIKVNVTSPPLTVPGGVLTSQTIPDKRDITLPCKTTAANKESLDMPRWFRNGDPLNQRNVPNSRYKFSEDYTELVIKDLQKDQDTANFQCNTSNSEGYLFYDAYLRVINSIAVTKRPADVNEIEHGDVIDITISAKGDYCCPINIMWLVNGTTITDPGNYPPFQKDPDSDSLLFNSSRVTDGELMSMYGLYACRVSNLYESVSVEFNILPKISKTAPIEEARRSGIDIWWIALLAGLLIIIIAVIIIVIIYKSNYPGSTYKLEEQEIKHNLNPEEDLLNQSFHEI